MERPDPDPSAPRPRREVWSFVNQKGGCGKTTTAVNLAGALVKSGERVLLIDNDPQAHATLALGTSAGPRASLAEVLLGQRTLDSIVVAVSPGLYLAPASLELARFENRAATHLRPEKALRDALDRFSIEVDWVLIDCPPRADGVLAACALAASTTVCLVVETGTFSLQGALRARGLLELLADELGCSLDLRVVATLFNARTRYAQEVLIGMQARFGDCMFDTAIRESVRLREAAGYGVPVEALDPDSKAAADFRALADEARAYARSRRLQQTKTPQSEQSDASADAPADAAAPEAEHEADR